MSIEQNQARKPPAPDAVVTFLMLFVAIAFINNGFGDNSTGVLWQPVTWYLKASLGWSAEQIAKYMTVLALPWMIMPVYPLFAMFLPIFGFRFKPYLFIASSLGLLAALILVFVEMPSLIIIGLFMASLGAAMITALAGAVLVENGKRLSINKSLVNSQWIWYWGATALAGVLGGALAGLLTPAGSFHAAAVVYGLAPLFMLAGTWWLLPSEEPSQIDLAGFKSSLQALVATFKIPVLWLMSLFVFFLAFGPSSGTAMVQYYLPDHLHFSEQFIGVLFGIAAAGSVVGGMLYAWLYKRVSTKRMLYLSILLCVAASCANVLMVGPKTAMLLYFVNGITNMLATVEALALAANYCPDKAEGFAYAILISVIYAAWQLSDNVGSVLYTFTNQNMTPLFLISAASTAVCLAFLPFLKLPDKT